MVSPSRTDFEFIDWGAIASEPQAQEVGHFAWLMAWKRRER